MPCLLPALLLLCRQKEGVDVSFSSTPLPLAMEQISRAIGRVLKVAPALCDEVLVTHVEAAQPEVLLKHIAEVFAAKWMDRSGTLWLVPDPQAERALVEKRAAQNASHLHGSFLYLQKRLSEQPAEYDAEGMARYLQRRDEVEKRRKEAEAKDDFAHMFLLTPDLEESPAWRAVGRIVLSMDEKDLLALANDDRVVWAEAPTPMQHAFPPTAAEVLGVYRRELALLKPNLTVARVKLVCKRWEQGSAMTFSLQAYDSAAKEVDKANVRMNDDSELMKKTLTERPHPLALGGQTPIRIPAEIQNFRRAMSTQSKGQDRAILFAKIRPMLLDPVRFEPTAMYVATDLLKAAEEAHVNLVATVSDFTGGTFFDSNPATPSQVFANREMAPLSTSDGWFVARPADEIPRVSRAQGKSFIADCLGDGGVTVDRAASWTAQFECRNPMVNWVGDYLNDLFSVGGPYSAMSTLMDEMGLRLWSKLGSSATDALKKGATLSYSQLPADAISHLERMVFMFSDLDDNQIDPTEAFPNGIHDGSVSMTITEKQVFYGWSSKLGPPAVPTPLDATMFGTDVAIGNSWLEVPAEIFRAYDRFKVGLNRTYALRFVLSPGNLPMTVRLTETVFANDAPILDELPKQIRDDVERVRQAALAAPRKPAERTVIPPEWQPF